jgi:hypothetical protein
LTGNASAVGISRKNFEIVIKPFFAMRFGAGKGVRPGTSKEQVLVVIRELLL